jgi:uncharacterized protein (TIGR03086 family)
MGTDAGELHLAVCRRFGAAVRSANAQWDRQTPCAAWNARDVLEHVIGFHDVLLLRPPGLKLDRPRDDPPRRWELTYHQLQRAFSHDRFDRTVLGADKLIPRLTQDVLVHTWDLARAIGADDALDPEWCAYFLGRLPADINTLNASGMFATPIAIADQTDAQSKLLTCLGRDPSWRGI